MARIDFVTGNAQRYLPEVEALATMPDRLEALLAGHSNAELQRAPDDGGWSAARIIGHLISYTRHSRAEFHVMVWMTDPPLPDWDEAAEATAQDWDRQDAARLLELLTEATSEAVEVLKEIPDASWGRAGIHPRSGRLSIRQLASRRRRHFEQHLKQLEQALDG